MRHGFSRPRIGNCTARDPLRSRRPPTALTASKTCSGALPTASQPNHSREWRNRSGRVECRAPLRPCFPLEFPAARNCRHPRERYSRELIVRPAPSAAISGQRTLPALAVITSRASTARAGSLSSMTLHIRLGPKTGIPWYHRHAVICHRELRIPSYSHLSSLRSSHCNILSLRNAVR